MIIHFTTVHPRSDTRIRLKEVATLAATFNCEVKLYVQDGRGDDVDAVGGYTIVDTGTPPPGRLRRMTFGAVRMYLAVRRARPTIAHFHDPELLPWALLLRLDGVKVIYDVHEDAPATVLSKEYLPAILRRPIAWGVRRFERLADQLCSAIVAATPAIQQNFSGCAILVQNFPLQAELALPTPAPYEGRAPYIAYVGGISAIRGAREMVEAITRVHVPEARLQVAGAFSPRSLEAALTNHPGWSRVDFHGWAGRKEVAEILRGVRAGLVLFHPLPNHIRAQPNKLFEYMAAGLPVIASDFPLWRKIVEGAGCGLLVDPQDPPAIAKAIQWILDHPAEAAAMGQRGRKAVEARFNWDVEAEKLVVLYKQLFEQKS